MISSGFSKKRIHFGLNIKSSTLSKSYAIDSYDRITYTANMLYLVLTMFSFFFQVAPNTTYDRLLVESAYFLTPRRQDLIWREESTSTTYVRYVVLTWIQYTVHTTRHTYTTVRKQEIVVVCAQLSLGGCMPSWRLSNWMRSDWAYRDNNKWLWAIIEWWFDRFLVKMVPARTLCLCLMMCKCWGRVRRRHIGWSWKSGFLWGCWGSAWRSSSSLSWSRTIW